MKIPCPGCFSVDVVSAMNKSNLGKNKFTGLTGYSLSLSEVTVGPQDRNLRAGRKQWKNTALVACSTTFYILPRPVCLTMVSPREGWALLH